MRKTIPLAKPELGEKEADAIREAVLSGWVTQGPRVAEFEKKFAEYAGTKYAVAVSSCTTALHLGLKVLGVSHGDEVIVSPHTFIASANAIRYCGATPVFVDIDSSLNINPDLVEAAITSKTKAIMVVHQVGRPADLCKLGEIAKKRGIPLIEDAACGIGSEYRGKKIGSNEYSPIVCFSFHPRKVITTGDGGMITISDPQIEARLKRLRQHGMSVNDLERHGSSHIVNEEYAELGYNYRMTDIQAAMGITQLDRLETIIQKRRELANRYNVGLCGIQGLELFHEPDGSRWNHQTYLIRLKNATVEQRDLFMQKMLDFGVATRRGIMSIHREECYIGKYGKQFFHESELASDQCVCIPLFTQLTGEEQDYVISRIKEIYENIFLS